MRQGAAEAAQPTGHHVFEHGKPAHQIELLEDHPDPLPKLPETIPRHACDVGAVEVNPATRRCDKVIKTAKQGGFTGPGRAEDCHQLMTTDVEIDFSDRLHASGENNLKPPGGKQRLTAD